MSPQIERIRGRKLTVVALSNLSLVGHFNSDQWISNLRNNWGLTHKVVLFSLALSLSLSFWGGFLLLGHVMSEMIPLFRSLTSAVA